MSSTPLFPLCYTCIVHILAFTPKAVELCDHLEDKPSGGLFQFMRKTKKIRHQPQEGGIYLEDLNLTDMDPEVAALYLYSAKR